MKRITTMFTGIALSAAMLFTGIAGYTAQNCFDDSYSITASAYPHSCGQFVYDSTGLKYVAGFKDSDGVTHVIYDEYNVKRCQNCGSIKSWGSKTGWRKLVVGNRSAWSYVG